MVQNVFIVAAKRTPFGAFGGKLKNISATDLCIHSTKAAIVSGKIDPSFIDSVCVGNVAQTSTDAAYISRHVQLKSNIPITATALTVNRLCGSGFQSVVTGLQEIQLEQSNIVVCGGTENMSQAPFAVYGQNARFGVHLGSDINLKDTLWSALTDSYAQTPMGMTAENLATKYKITRQECDELALRSQENWSIANKSGVFNDEIVSIEVKGKKGKKEIFNTDEHPRIVTYDKLSLLNPVFKKDNGVVTAGNASGISDGAGTVILAGEKAIKKNNLTPISKIVSYAVAGVEPSIMGIGPVPAIQKALKNANLTLNDMDIIDINEAFAAQFLACQKELKFDMKKANLSGGAISLGHPLGASGSRITAHLAHALKRTNKKYAVGAACIGGGQGIAVILENVSK